MAGLAAAALVLLVDGIWAGRAMFRGVATARSALGEGAVAVVTGDPQAARPFFDRAADAADATVAATVAPFDRTGGAHPLARRQHQGGRGRREGIRTECGCRLGDGRRRDDPGWEDIRVPAAETLGAVDLPTLRAATPKLDEVAKSLGVAEAQLSGADTGRLVGPIAAGFQDALDTLRRRYEICEPDADLARLLPGFLGAGGSRTYLLAVQTLGLPQGTGGRVDLIGTLVAQRGTLTVDGPLVPAGPTYADANVSPDGPTTAQELLRLADASGLGEMDGVVLIDSVWLQDALWVTGQVEIPGRRQPLTMDPCRGRDGA